MKKIFTAIFISVSSVCYSAAPDPLIQKFSSAENFDQVRDYLFPMLSPEGRAALEKFRHVNIEVRDERIVNVWLDMNRSAVIECCQQVKENIVQEMQAFADDKGINVSNLSEAVDETFSFLDRNYLPKMEEDESSRFFGSLNYTPPFRDDSLHSEFRQSAKNCCFINWCKYRDEVCLGCVNRRQIEEIANASDPVLAELSDFARPVSRCPAGSDRFGISPDNLMLITFDSVMACLEQQGLKSPAAFRNLVDDQQQIAVSWGRVLQKSSFYIEVKTGFSGSVLLAVIDSEKERYSQTLHHFVEGIVPDMSRTERESFVMFLAAHELRAPQNAGLIIILSSLYNAKKSLFAMNYPVLVFNTEIGSEFDLYAISCQSYEAESYHMNHRLIFKHELFHGSHLCLGFSSLSSSQEDPFWSIYSKNPFTKAICSNEYETVSTKIQAKVTELMGQGPQDDAEKLSALARCLIPVSPEATSSVAEEFTPQSFSEALTKFTFSEIWSYSEEFATITGVRLVNGKVFVEQCSDLGVSLETGEPARWGHLAGEKEGWIEYINQRISNAEYCYSGSEVLPFAEWYYRELLTSLVWNLAPDPDAFRILTELYQMKD
ncbi:MAG: hypothetical protein LBL30_03040 [Holosporales bacterium]|jgi:hypothetical protein|nr:hypothetical protein [Holosporales bacterium]